MWQRAISTSSIKLFPWWGKFFFTSLFCLWACDAICGFVQKGTSELCPLLTSYPMMTLLILICCRSCEFYGCRDSDKLRLSCRNSSWCLMGRTSEYPDSTVLIRYVPFLWDPPEPKLQKRMLATEKSMAMIKPVDSVQLYDRIWLWPSSSSSSPSGGSLKIIHTSINEKSSIRTGIGELNFSSMVLLDPASDMNRYGLKNTGQPAKYMVFMLLQILWRLSEPQINYHD